MIEVLPTQLIPGDNEGKVLRVRLIMKEGVKFFNPVYLFDEGSTISWIPCGRKLTCSYPGIKFTYGPDTYYGQEVHTCMFGLHLYYDARLFFLMLILCLCLNQCYLGLLKCNKSLKLCSSRRKSKINIKLIFRRFGHVKIIDRCYLSF